MNALNTPDSVRLLEEQLASAQTDEARIDSLNALANLLKTIDARRGVHLSDEAYTLSVQRRYEQGIAVSLYTRGMCQYYLSNQRQALADMSEAHARFVRENDAFNTAKALNWLGNIYRSFDEYATALESYFKSLKLLEAIGENHPIAVCLNGIAGMYDLLGDEEKALKYYFQSLEKLDANDTQSRAATLSNIGFIYETLEQFDNAFEYQSKSRDLSQKVQDKRGEATAVAGIVSVLKHQGDITHALGYMPTYLTLAEASGDKDAEAEAHITFGTLLSEKGDAEAGITHFKEALHIIERLNLKLRSREVHDALAAVYQQTGNYPEAFAHLQQARLAEKELMSEQSSKRTKSLQIQFEVERTERDKELYRQRNTELGRVNDALREANQLKTELLGIAAHDLKNPLQSILGFAELIIEEASSVPAVSQKAASISQAAWRMVELVNSLLETAAIDSGKLELVKTQVNLSQLAERVLEGNAQQAAAKSLTIHFSGDANSDKYTIDADAERLYECIDNLVSNAIKYSPSGAKIAVSCRLLADSQELTVKRLQLRVEDEGQGLSADDMKKLFGKFQRLSAKPTGGESSTGLGLSIAKHLVELHNGKIWAESAGKGYGSTFYIELPVPLQQENPNRP